MKPHFEPGRNIAMKVPVHEYEATVAFYRDILGLKTVVSAHSEQNTSSRFEFGDKILWVDSVQGISQAEIWLEVVTREIAQASEYLAGHRCVRCDEIEPLPDGMAAFWLSSPANIIHLVCESDEV